MRKEKEKGDLLTLPALLVQKHKYWRYGVHRHAAVRTIQTWYRRKIAGEACPKAEVKGDKWLFNLLLYYTCCDEVTNADANPPDNER
jgi:hypothetical protein